MRYQILDDNGVITDTIIADIDIMLSRYPAGNYQIEQDITEAKTAAIARIKAAFDDEITNTGTMVITEGVIDSRRSDLDNLKNLSAYLYGMNIPETQLRMADNSMITVTAARLEEIVAELIGHGLIMYQSKWMLITEIESATTIAEVDAVKW